MAFDGTEGDEIELVTAAAWTKNYRGEHPDETKGHFFGKTLINDILNQSGCMGIRMYYAIDDDGNKQLVLAGANTYEDDMHTGVLGDASMPCPTYCGRRNSLNS